MCILLCYSIRNHTGIIIAKRASRESIRKAIHTEGISDDSAALPVFPTDFDPIGLSPLLIDTEGVVSGLSSYGLRVYVI
jgi:hypothetical protein